MVNVKLLNDNIHLMIIFYCRQGYIKDISDEENGLVSYTLNDNDKLATQYNKINNNIKKVFNFDGNLSLKNNKSDDSFEYEEYLIEE